MYSKEFTYEGISKASGLSIATISRVFNKSPHVRQETRERVIEAMKAIGMDPLDYDLQPVDSDRIILFNLASLKNPFYSSIISASITVAARHGYTLFLYEYDINKDNVDSFIELLKRTHVAGAIIANTMEDESIRKIASYFPVVTCCEAFPQTDIPFVSVDNRKTAENAVSYLISLGKRRIAFINGPKDFEYARSRAEGYLNALGKAGLEADQNLIVSMGPDMDYDMAKAAAMHMLSLPDSPDAFFCISDVLATAAIKASIEMGKRVPEDVAVVGFDDIQLASIMNPSITTVRQPRAQIGSLATEMLIKLIEGKDKPSSMYLGAEFIVRESARF